MALAYIIAFRESIEASLIIATIIGILAKLRYHRAIRAVWFGTAVAFICTMIIIGGGAGMGNRFRALMTRDTQEATGAVLNLISACFITWAVLFLHRTFARGKVRLLAGFREMTKTRTDTGIFLLTFTSVIREGMEVGAFLSTTYLTTSSFTIVLGVFFGLLSGALIALGVFATSIRLSVLLLFRVSTVLLISFAAGMVARSIGILTALHLLRPTRVVLLPLPDPSSVFGGMIRVIFGISKTMDLTALLTAALYITLMTWWLQTDALRRRYREVKSV